MAKSKAGSSKRFGPRYSMKARRKWAEIDRRQKLRYECPVCHRLGVRRKHSGVWQCRKCGVKFTGGAYIPTTPMHSSVKRAIKKVVEG